MGGNFLWPSTNGWLASIRVERVTGLLRTYRYKEKHSMKCHIYSMYGMVYVHNYSISYILINIHTTHIFNYLEFLLVLGHKSNINVNPLFEVIVILFDK